MPRINYNEYENRHTILKLVWNQNQGTFALLEPAEQWLIHDYYQPSKDLTHEQLREHRGTISKERPSLPHQAGKVYASLAARHQEAQRAYVKLQEQSPALSRARRPIGKDRGPIRVRAVVRPEIDVEKLSRVVISMMQAMDKEAGKQKYRAA
jgi:hypothetical protein